MTGRRRPRNESVAELLEAGESIIVELNGVVTGLVFLFVYYGVGRPLAQRHDPPLGSPYLAVVLTDRRVLLFDRALGAEAPELIESAALRDVSTIRYSAAGLLVPQRLGFVIKATERREFEFPRSEPVKKFVDNFAS